MKGDLAETKNHSQVTRRHRSGRRSPEEQSRRTQEQIVAGEVISTVDEEVFLAVRQQGWVCTEKELWLVCESAGNSTSGRAHSPTAMLCFLG